jgi:hypothetical protein
MLDFLKSFEQNPTAETLDQLWTVAADNNLHHSVMTFGQLALQFRQIQNQPIFPDCQRLISRLGISGFYTKDQDDFLLGRWANELLYLNPIVDSSIRNTARKNHIYYVKNIKELADSVVCRRLSYRDIQWNVNNPSVVQWRDQLWMIQRSVNYNILPDGSYDTGDHTPIQTQNYLVKLDQDYNVVEYRTIQNPDVWPEPKYNLVKGFEDCRPFVWDDQLHCSATVREQNNQGRCEIYMMTIDGADGQTPKFVNPVKIPGPDPTGHEKNWMPMTPTARPTWIYMTDPTIVINGQSRVLSIKQNSIAAENFRGGGQIIIFRDSLLAIIHESVDMPSGLREYVHRFVTFGRDLKISAVSERFKFIGHRIEFAAGLTNHPVTNDIVVSFGINDQQSWLCSINEQQVADMLKPITQEI